ncbi:MAG: SDR family NAD(P)-dependent oxidoreductase [Bacilli bacterium]
MQAILVTGASGDIGVSFIKQTLKSEPNTYIYAQYNNNRAALDVFLHDARVIPIQADLSKIADVRALCAQCTIPVSRVLYAAGGAHYALFQDTEETVMDRLYHIHVKSLWLISQWAVEQMIPTRAGAILVLSSVWAERGAALEVVYSTVKAAQLGFVKSLAKEVAPSNVRVNALVLGAVDTAVLRKDIDNVDLQILCDDIPVNRLAQPDEVAAFCHTLFQTSSFLTGGAIPFHGGWI